MHPEFFLFLEWLPPNARDITLAYYLLHSRGQRIDGLWPFFSKGLIFLLFHFHPQKGDKAISLNAKQGDKAINTQCIPDGEKKEIFIDEKGQ